MDLNKFFSLVKSKYLRETKVYADFELYETISELIIPKKEFDELIDQLDEPEKVVVPDFAGEWIKKQRTYNYENVHIALQRALSNADDVVSNWVRENKDEYARAWLDGWTVEKEKTYRVKLPDNESKSTTNILALRRTQDGRIVINQVSKTAFIENENSFLTEDEIKRNHEYLWGFAEEVESE